MTDLEEIPDGPDWHIVVWVIQHTDADSATDHWQTFESFAEAHTFYNNLLLQDPVTTASVAKVRISTDYGPL